MTPDTTAQITIDSLDKPNTLPIVGLAAADFWVLTLPAIAGLLTGMVLGLGLPTIALCIVGILLGSLLVYVSPPYLTSISFLRVLARYAKRPSLVPNVAPDAEPPAESIFQRVQADERTSDVTNVETYYPGRGVIERPDGSMVAAIELHPPGMDLAKQADNERVTDVCERVANVALDFDVQLYVTTRPFPIDDHIAELDERLNDPDIEQDASMAALLEEIIETRPADLEAAGTSTLRYYLLVDADPEDVVTSDAARDRTPLEKLAALPVVGIPFLVFARYQRNLDADTQRARLFRLLDERLQSIERHLVGEIHEYESDRLSTGDWVALLDRFWSDHESPRSADDHVRASPVVTGPPSQSPTATDGGTETMGGGETVSPMPADEESETEFADGDVPSPDDSAADADTSADADPTGDDADPDDDDDSEDDRSLLERLGFGRPSRDEWAATVLQPLTSDDVDTAGATETADTDDDPATDTVPDLADVHQQQLAPEDLERGFRNARIGDEYRRTMVVDEWPDELQFRPLQRLFARPELQFDLSMHLRPRDRSHALDDAERRVQGLTTDADTTGGFTASDKTEAAERTAAVRDQLEDGQRPFEVSLYLSTRADSEDDLADRVGDLRSVLEDAPANMGVATVSGAQLRALESTAPIGRDPLGTDSAFDTTQVMLGRGVGTLLGSCQQSGILESGGVELGEHAINGGPLIKNPFESETNYNLVTIGDSGSGKSYSTKQMALRTKLTRPDTTLIILDPLQGFEGLCETLDADRITIGGSRGMNPLELQAPTDPDQLSTDVDPLAAKLKDVMSFFDNFATQQGVELGGARSVLASAVSTAYRNQGITHDVTTHDNESPTIDDVLDVLEAMSESPAEYVVRTVNEAETIRTHATTLIGYFRPFVDGQYAALNGSSTLDIRDSDVVYLDLSQQEGSMRGGKGLLMQLTFSAIYECAKATPDDVVFIIDEARFLMRDASNLAFLGQRVRHSRHYDTSIRFITQNVQDFFAHEEAESIINNAFMKVLHRTEEIAEWQDVFGLNDRQISFVQRAQTGDAGYSEALVEIDGRWYPLQLFATDAEDAVIDG